MAKKYVLSVAAPLTAEKCESIRDKLSKQLGVPGDDILILAAGTTLTEIDVAEKPCESPAPKSGLRELSPEE